MDENVKNWYPPNTTQSEYDKQNNTSDLGW